MPDAPGGGTDLAPPRGLTPGEVAERVASGLTNDVPNPTSRTYVEIVRANIFTLFNALLGALLLMILIVKEYRDALFGFVLVANALIGMVQESRAKRTLDRLTLTNAPKVTVRRDGASFDVPPEGLVLDDLIELGLGDQATVDGTITEAVGLEIDESLLTGEADPVTKDVGDPVLSGSFVVAGSGAFRATKVGRDTYAYGINEEASRFSRVRSELNDGINKILKVISFLIGPTMILLVIAQFRREDNVTDAIQRSVAGGVAMVPEGLVLLTSMAYALGVLRLGNKNVLTQELAAIEGLARVDVLCVDKTGTLTEGKLVLSSVEPLAGQGDPGQRGFEVEAVLAAMAAADPNPNASMAAVGEEFDQPPPWEVTGVVPFSSARKWSATAFVDDAGTWVFGAPDIVGLKTAEPSRIESLVRHHAERGRRVLLLAEAPGGLTGEDLPERLDAVALVVLEEKVRDDAPDTVEYFKRQNVQIKVISGDNAVTVGAVAQRCGIDGSEAPVDARNLPTDQAELADALERSTVFGRVTPQQKREMVHALQSHRHEVAMTGDGVNDTLALKDAEVGVAMGSGSPAARAVARFVLLDNSFAVFPSVVAEGRRVIGNVERVANLFVTKTVYAVCLALVVGLSSIEFPFVPRHMTVISSLTIGIPAFFLALAPNSRRARSGFLRRVMRFTAPAGVLAAGATLMTYWLLKHDIDGTDAATALSQAQTGAIITLFIVAMWVLGIFARPFRLWKVMLVATMVGCFVAVLSVPSLRNYFAIYVPPQPDLMAAIGVGIAACVCLEAGGRLLSGVEARRGTDQLLDMGLRRREGAESRPTEPDRSRVRDDVR